MLLGVAWIGDLHPVIQDLHYPDENPDHRLHSTKSQNDSKSKLWKFEDSCSEDVFITICGWLKQVSIFIFVICKLFYFYCSVIACTISKETKARQSLGNSRRIMKRMKHRMCRLRTHCFNSSNVHEVNKIKEVMWSTNLLIAIYNYPMACCQHDLLRLKKVESNFSVVCMWNYTQVSFIQ